MYEHLRREAAADPDKAKAAASHFGELLALGPHPGPRVILLRRAPHRSDEQAKLLLAVLGEVTPDLEAGAVVVVSRDRARIRRLPIDG